jgi:hypothetical protein
MRPHFGAGIYDADVWLMRSRFDFHLRPIALMDARHGHAWSCLRGQKKVTIHYELTPLDVQ